MAKKNNTSFSVSIEGLEELSKVPGWLEHAQREHLESAAKKIADKIGDTAPKRSGKLAGSWSARTISSTKAQVSSDSKYAKAQERGAFIQAKPGKFLRFEIGGRPIFTKFVRLKGSGYAKKALRSRGKIIREEYAKAFSDISR